MNGRELDAVHFNQVRCSPSRLKRTRRIFGLLLFSAFLFTAIGCIPYRKGGFKGPATVSDTGVFSYYRYHFSFSPAMPLDNAGRQTYTFRGLPKDPMIVRFGIESFDYREYERMESLHTTLEVELRDDRGSLLCSGSGSLSESLRGVPDAEKNDDHWILAAGGGSAAFWRQSCANVKFHSGRTFTMILKLDNIDPRTPAGLSITPWIEGGGIELP